MNWRLYNKEELEKLVEMFESPAWALFNRLLTQRESALVNELVFYSEYSTNGETDDVIRGRLRELGWIRGIAYHIESEALVNMEERGAGESEKEES